MLVGGGIGAAPLLCLQEELDEPTVLLGFRSAAHAQAAALFGGDPRWSPTTARSAARRS